MITFHHRPALDERAVQQALDALRLGSFLREHPLLFFVGIHSRLQAPHITAGDAALQVAVFDHLSETIEAHLSRLRHLCGLAAPSGGCDTSDLVGDFRQGNRELEAWSLLYYRYVCVQLDLSMEAIAALVGQDERTLRRRHRRAITRLTLALVSQEQEARRSAARARLRLALPVSEPFRLIGRESLLATARHILIEAEPPHHLLLHGPSGIGKTAAALSLAHELVNADHFGDLLWLELGEIVDPATLLGEIAARLGLHVSPGMAPEQVLRAYISLHPILIILDHAECLLDAGGVEALLGQLGSAWVILISRVLDTSLSWLYQIEVLPLSREQALELLEMAAQQQHPRRQGWLDRFNEIWQAVGGNPLLLRTLWSAAQNLPLGTALRHTQSSYLHHHIWKQLGPNEQRVWLSTLLFGLEGMPHRFAATLTSLSPDAADQALDRLARSGLLTVQNSQPDDFRYLSQPFTAGSVLDQVRQGLSISGGELALDYLRTALRRWVSILAGAPCPRLAQLALGFVASLDLSPVEQVAYGRALYPQMAGAALWQDWVTFARPLLGKEWRPIDAAWLNITTGVALRWLGQFDQSKACLLDALGFYAPDETGRADVLCELAVISRYHGEWEEAQQHALDALSLFTSGNVQAGTERAVHELAQLALERQEPDRALAWLSRLGSWAARTWGIASQAYLLAGQLDGALEAAHQALALLPVDHPNQGRALATLGQVHDAFGRTGAAVECLLVAAEELDRARDVIGYARVCNNLAVAYHRQAGKRHPARSGQIRHLLSQALDIQQQIGDRIGQAVTRQNLFWLDALG